MRTILTAIMVALVLAVIVLGLVSCAADDNAAARRAQAEADAQRAAAEAYQQRQQADTAAAAERSAIRQTEQDAAHRRALELLPYLALILGGLLLAGFGGLLFWDLRRRPAVAPTWQPQAPALPAPPTINVFVLPERAGGRGRVDYWRQIEAAASGQASRGPVTIYQDDRQ